MTKKPPKPMIGSTGGEDQSATLRPNAALFDPARLRLDPSMDLVTLSQAILEVRVGRPSQQDFIRVHPDLDFVLPTFLIEFDRVHYLIDPCMHAELASEVYPVVLYTAINRAGTIQLWPAKLPKPGAKPLPWHTTAHNAADLARKAWVRVVTGTSCYEAFRAEGTIAEPQWPDKSLQDLLAIGFQDRLITSASHPVVKALRGID